MLWEGPLQPFDTRHYEQRNIIPGWRPAIVIQAFALHCILHPGLWSTAHVSLTLQEVAIEVTIKHGWVYGLNQAGAGPVPALLHSPACMSYLTEHSGIGGA